MPGLEQKVMTKCTITRPSYPSVNKTTLGNMLWELVIIFQTHMQLSSLLPEEMAPEIKIKFGQLLRLRQINGSIGHVYMKAMK